MNKLFTRGFSNHALSAALVLAAITLPGSAMAQSGSGRAVCNTHGPNWVEPVGDRDGHAVLVSEGNCVIQGGLLDGTVQTQQTIWEYDKGVGTMLSSHGVSRKPGAMAVFVNASGTQTLQMTDGRVTGWTATGKGKTPMASGAAASLAGKTYSWTARATGPRTYVVDVVYE